MQFNQPVNNGYQCEQLCPYFPPQLPYSNIVGEGDIVSLTIPDGTVQFFFIPKAQKRDTRLNPYHPYYGQAQGPIEAWFVRKISTPIIPNVMQENMSYEDPFLRSYYATKPNGALLPQMPFYQKFHSDNVTSTTDIHYFFPRQTTLKHSAFVQVEHPTKYSNSSQTDNVGRTCSCPKNSGTSCEYTKIDSGSAMSIDEDVQPKRRIKTPKVNFKMSKSRERKVCSCKHGQTDKMISTYTDRSVNCARSCHNSHTPGKESQSSISTNSPCNSCCRTCFLCTTDISDGFE